MADNPYPTECIICNAPAEHITIHIEYLGDPGDPSWRDYESYCGFRCLGSVVGNSPPKKRWWRL